MKYLYIIAILFLQITGCCGQNAVSGLNKSITNDSIIYSKIYNTDFNEYIGKKTISEFLANIGYPYIDHSYSTARPHYLSFIFFIYSDNLWIEIEPGSYEYSS